MFHYRGASVDKEWSEKREPEGEGKGNYSVCHLVNSIMMTYWASLNESNCDEWEATGIQFSSLSSCHIDPTSDTSR